MSGSNSRPCDNQESHALSAEPARQSLCFFLLPNNIPFLDLSNFSSIRQLIDTWFVFTLGLLHIMLPWTLVYKIFNGHIFAILLGLCLRMELPPPLVTRRVNLWWISRLFPKCLPHFTFPPAVCEDSNAWPHPCQPLLLASLWISPASWGWSRISWWFCFVLP